MELPNTKKSALKKDKKLNPKTRNNIILVVIAIILIIIMIVFISSANGSKDTYNANYGNINTSIIINQKKAYADLTVMVNGKEFTQRYDLVKLEEHQYKMQSGDEEIKLVLEDNKATLIYSDNTTVIYNKE